MGENERILRRVLGICRRSQGSQRGTVDGAAMPVHQFAERGVVAFARPGNQVGVVHTDSRHTGAGFGWG